MYPEKITQILENFIKECGNNPDNILQAANIYPLHKFKKAATLNDNQSLNTLANTLPAVEAQNSSHAAKSYETELMDSLKSDNNAELPDYFNATRIQEYLLGQIAALEERGAIGGANSMRTILNRQLPLAEKLKLLGAIGEGKSNNSSLSLSRMGRRSEVAKFYKDIQVFSKIESNTEVTSKFKEFLKVNRKIDFTEASEREIQKYALIRQNLGSLSPGQDGSLHLNLQELCKTSLSSNPFKVFEEIQATKNFLAFPGNEAALKEEIQKAQPQEQEVFYKQYSGWIVLAVKGSVLSSNEISWIGCAPTVEEIKKCCELLNENTGKLGKNLPAFIAALATAILSAENSKNNSELPLIDALMQEINSKSGAASRAQDVLNQVFYQVTAKKDKKLLEKLAVQVSEHKSPQGSTEQSNQHSETDDLEREKTRLKCEEEVLSYLHTQIDNLRPKLHGILPGNKKISGAAAMHSILNSGLPFEQKLQLLSAIGKAKSEQSYSSVTRSKEAQHFYALLNHDNIKVMITSILYQMNGRKDSLTVDEAQFAIKYFSESTKDFSNDAQFSVSVRPTTSQINLS